MKEQKVYRNFILTHQDELVERIGWLIRVRWLAGLGVTSTIIAATSLFDLIVDRNLLLLVSSSIFIFNLLYSFYFPKLQRQKDIPGWHRKIALFANIQISLDLIILNILIYLSGGAENPFYFYSIFHMIIASMLLSSTASYLQATLAVLLFNLMLTLEWLDLIPHHQLYPFFEEELFHHSVVLLGLSGVFTTTIFISVYMATSITSKLRQREEEMLELKNSLEQANLEMKKVHEYRSWFLLKVEHELKAPLAAIQSLIAVILTSFASTLTPKVTDLLTRAEKRTHNLLEMIRRLLELSRMQTVDHYFKSRPVDLKSIITRQIDLLRSQVEEKSLSLRKEIPEDLPQLTGDPEAIEQVIMNLLSNAVKYTDKGGVEVEAVPDGNYIRIIVSDTGIGMSEEELTMIFEEFYRGTLAKEKYEGTGLGLSIVKEIVEGHGGRIEVESTPGKGSHFTVILPGSKEKNITLKSCP